MEELIKRNLALIVFTATLFILTPVFTVITRNVSLPFDPVLLLWAAIFSVLAAYKFRTLLSLLVLSLPLLVAGFLPLFGFDDLQGNPNNHNLLDYTYYRYIGIYLIIAITLLAKRKRPA